MKLLCAISAVVCATLLAGTAHAADMRPVTKAPPLAPVAAYNWTGFYVGAHGGVAQTDKRWFLPGGPEVANYDERAFIGGGQAGFNWQTGNRVFGAEVQQSFGEIRKGVLWVDPDPQPYVEQDNLRTVRTKRIGTSVKDPGTIAARVGYAFDNVLLYAKGGAAWAHDIYRAFSADTGVERLIASTTGTRWGWMVGAGIEYGFAPNWSVKAEFNYLDFGTERVTLISIPAVTPATRDFDIEQSVALIKFGINYRFGAGPVVARY